MGEKKRTIYLIIERKKEEVTQRVVSYVERHSGLELTDDDIDAIIEAVVNSVKMKG